MHDTDPFDIHPESYAIVNDENLTGPLGHCTAVSSTENGLEATITLAPGARVVKIADWRRERAERKAAAARNSARRYLGGPHYAPRGDGPGVA